MAFRLPIEIQGNVETVDVPVEMRDGYYLVYNNSDLSLLFECPGKWRHHYEHEIRPRRVRIYNSRAEAEARPNKVTCEYCGRDLYFAAWLKNGEKNNGEENIINKRKIAIHAYMKKGLVRKKGKEIIKHVISTD